MRLEKLGENLYQVYVSTWPWNTHKKLAKVLLQIQEQGKTITCVVRTAGSWSYDYLVCTTSPYSKEV